MNQWRLFKVKFLFLASFLLVSHIVIKKHTAYVFTFFFYKNNLIYLIKIDWKISPPPSVKFLFGIDGDWYREPQPVNM